MNRRFKISKKVGHHRIEELETVNQANTNAQERVYRHNFNLKNMKYNNRDTYYLVIEDKSGVQLPQREAFQIDIAMVIDNFNFFD